MTPVKIPGIAVGKSTIQTVCVFVAPMPIAASFMRAGTMRIASSGHASTHNPQNTHTPRSISN